MICTIKHLPIMQSLFSSPFEAISAKGKQWKVGEVIDIAFMGGTQEQQRFVKEAAAEWLSYANVHFRYINDATKSDVRIAFMEGQGAWSYVGTDAMGISKLQPTMNLGWLDRETVLHEFGHMLSMLHEHQNPKGGIEWNEPAVIKDLKGPPNNWDIRKIRHNVLDKEEPSNTNFTEFDPDSIMLYFFPGKWTKSGIGTKANPDLSITDKEYIAALYPRI